NVRGDELDGEVFADLLPGGEVELVARLLVHVGQTGAADLGDARAVEVLRERDRQVCDERKVLERFGDEAESLPGLELRDVEVRAVGVLIGDGALVAA